MDNLSVEDIKQLFLNTLCMYKGDPVYVYSVLPDRTVKFYTLLDKDASSAKFSLEDFRSPAARLGMVNVFDSVVYAERVPIRRYSVGLSRENFNVISLNVPYPSSARECLSRIQSRNCIEIAKTLKGIFPSIPEAIKNAFTNEGACAFDRQFAVTCKGELFYKDKRVGVVNSETIEITEKNFKENYKYLSILIGNEYEKGSGNYRL